MPAAHCRLLRKSGVIAGHWKHKCAYGVRGPLQSHQQARNSVVQPNYGVTVPVNCEKYHCGVLFLLRRCRIYSRGIVLLGRGDFVRDCSHGFGTVVKNGKFFLEIVFTNGTRIQTCRVDTPPNGVLAQASILDSLHSIRPECTTNFQRGATVDHELFGLGYIVKVSPDAITVRFQHGGSRVAVVHRSDWEKLIILTWSLSKCQAEIKAAKKRRIRLERVTTESEPVSCDSGRPDTIGDVNRRAERPSLQQCPECGTLVRFDRMQKHRRRVHAPKRAKRFTVPKEPKRKTAKRSKASRPAVSHRLFVQGGLCSPR